MGSILGVVDPATGTASARYDYAAFGQRTATGALGQRYGFTGREEDAESSLLYFRARHYDPATGTFLQRDPIGFASGDLNLYAYVWNNPTRGSDPSGLSSVDHAGTAGRASAGGAFGAGVGTIGRGVWALVRDIARKVDALIGEVAATFGFSDWSRFSATYGRLFGERPVDMRRKAGFARQDPQLP